MYVLAGGVFRSINQFDRTGLRIVYDLMPTNVQNLSYTVDDREIED